MCDDLVNDWNLCKTFPGQFRYSNGYFISFSHSTMKKSRCWSFNPVWYTIHAAISLFVFSIVVGCFFFFLLFFFRMVSTREAKELFGFRYYVVYINPLFHRLSLCVCWSPLIFCSFSLFSLSVCRLLLLNLFFFSYVSLMLNAHFTNGFSVAIFASRWTLCILLLLLLFYFTEIIFYRLLWYEFQCASERKKGFCAFV